MRLWKKALAAFKDRRSLWEIALSRRTAACHPDIEKAVIRATFQSELPFDRRSIHRVCEWLRVSPYNLIPLLRAVSGRLARTRHWTVALKGLCLMHSVINSDLPCVKAIGRLPFDLSDFNRGCAHKARSWPFDAFVRAYYAFLDQKSAIIFMQGEEKLVPNKYLIAHELATLQKLQALIDLLLQIKPQSGAAFVPLVLDVMDWITMEICDLYSRICRGISLVLLNIYSAGKAEARLALTVVQKATQQGEDLAEYFKYYRKLGIAYSSGFPVVQPVPAEGIHELEQIINTFSDDEDRSEHRDAKANHDNAEINNSCDDNNREEPSSRKDELKTVITSKWEKFNEEMPDFISL